MHEEASLVTTECLVEVFWAFGKEVDNVTVKFETLVGGLINTTLRVMVTGDRGTLEEEWVLQRLNTNVFRNPEAISNNVRVAVAHLRVVAPDYVFPAGELKQIKGGDWWKLAPYIKNTRSLHSVETVEHAEAAARQFAKLCRLLSTCPQDGMVQTIDGFHDLRRHQSEYEENLVSAPKHRREICAIKNLTADIAVLGAPILEAYTQAACTLPLRIVHHDAKLGNILFNETGNDAVCVVDLDTLMPGLYISDLGDLIRTSVSPVSEEEPDATKVSIRMDYYQAVLRGFLSELRSVLTPEETKLIVDAGEISVYMQVIRFLGDYLSGNIYYKTMHEFHNLDRASNQLSLLKGLVAMRSDVKRVIEDILK